MRPEEGSDRTVLWSPPRDRVESSQMWAFNRWLADRFGVDNRDYQALHAWSVAHLADFWESVWEYFDVKASAPGRPVLAAEQMPGVEWFSGARLNYAENLLRQADRTPDAVAIVGEHESLPTTSMTWRELSEKTAALAAELRRLGVRPGDKVVGFLPHLPETVVSLLAVASVGAVWSVVNTDFGRDGAVDRFGQLEPKVLIGVDGYDYNGRFHSMVDRVAELRAALPTVEHVIVVDQTRDRGDAPLPEDFLRMSTLLSATAEPDYQQVPFDHPLWVLFSSGTTGKPKGIVHSHGGIILEGLKSNALHYDVRPGDLVYYAVSTTWAVWNMVVDTLLAGATIVTYDGAPTVEGNSMHLDLAAKHRVQMFGAGAAVLALAQKSQGSGARVYDLTQLRTIMVTGSPLPSTTWRWIYEDLKLDVMVCSESGGTEVATPFVGANPLGDVCLGESMGACLGVAAEAWDGEGGRLIDAVGELVITEPMPSMPIYLWGDHDHERYRATYFSAFPGVWRHGDWITEHADGSFVVHGRSDATINRGGIRMGSGDITQVVDQLDFVDSSMVIGAELEDGAYFMPLFVVMVEGEELTQERVAQVRETIRSRVSPRYVPDEIIAAPAIPRTRTGKMIEVPIKRLFQGADVGDINAASADDPAALQWYADCARRFLRTQR